MYKACDLNITEEADWVVSKSSVQRLYKFVIYHNVPEPLYSLHQGIKCADVCLFSLSWSSVLIMESYIINFILKNRQATFMWECATCFLTHLYIVPIIGIALHNWKKTI